MCGNWKTSLVGTDFPPVQLLSNQTKVFRYSDWQDGCWQTFPTTFNRECMNYTAIFLTDGLYVVYHMPYTLEQGMGPEIWGVFFCLLVTTHRLQVFVGCYCKWATVALQHPCCSTHQPRAIEVLLGKRQSTVPCCCEPGGHIQKPLRVFTIVHGSKGLRVVLHLHAHISQCPSGAHGVVLKSALSVVYLM